MQAGDVYLILNVILKMSSVFERLSLLSLAYVLWNLCQRRKSLYETNVRSGQYSKRFLCVSGLSRDKFLITLMSMSMSDVCVHVRVHVHIHVHVDVHIRVHDL